MFREGRGKSETLSSASELGPAHAALVSHPLPLRCHCSWSYGLSFLLIFGGLLLLHLYTGHQQWTESVRLVQDIATCSAFVWSLPFSSPTYLRAAICYGNAPKCVRNSHLTSESLPFYQGGMASSLGAGNVVYHHLAICTKLGGVWSGACSSFMGWCG
jgi:hypothetical protein